MLREKDAVADGGDDNPQHDEAVPMAQSGRGPSRPIQFCFSALALALLLVVSLGGPARHGTCPRRSIDQEVQWRWDICMLGMPSHPQNSQRWKAVGTSSRWC